MGHERKRRSDYEWDSRREAPQHDRAPGKRTLVASEAPFLIHRSVDGAAAGRPGGAAPASASDIEAPATGPALEETREASGAPGDPSGLVNAAQESTGEPLPQPLRQKFEGSLGAGLGSVRLHTGAASSAAARAVGAKAYAVGQDIHFGAGHFNLGTPEGEHLLAHEVAHTVQQDPAQPTRQNKLEVSSPGDAAEREADEAAGAMVAGRPAQVSARTVGISRKPEGESKGGEGGEGGEGGGGPGVEHAGSFELAKKEIGEGEIGQYFKFKASLSGAVDYASAVAGDEESKTKVKVGAKGSEKGAGIAGGVEHELEEWSLGELGKVQPTVNLPSFELTTEGIKVTGLGFTLSTPKGSPVKIDFKVLELVLGEWKPGEEPVIAGLETQAAAGFPLGDFKGYKISLKGALTLMIEPNYATIGKWLAEKAAEMLSADLAVVGGIVAAGVATLWSAAYAVIHKDDIANEVDAAVAKCKSYARGFDAGVKGGAAPGGAGGAKGFADGKAWAQAREKIANASGGSVAEAAKDVDIYAAGWNKAWPRIKQDSIDAYWQEHSVEKWLTGGEGMGSGGFKTFKRTLDAAGSRVRR